MTPAVFDVLLKKVTPYITKSSAIRDTTSPAERLAVTLRYLATAVTLKELLELLIESVQLRWDESLERQLK